MWTVTPGEPGETVRVIMAIIRGVRAGAWVLCGTIAVSDSGWCAIISDVCCGRLPPASRGLNGSWRREPIKWVGGQAASNIMLSNIISHAINGMAVKLISTPKSRGPNALPTPVANEAAGFSLNTSYQSADRLVVGCYQQVDMLRLDGGCQCDPFRCRLPCSDANLRPAADNAADDARNQPSLRLAEAHRITARFGSRDGTCDFIGYIQAVTGASQSPIKIKKRRPMTTFVSGQPRHVACPNNM